MGDAIGQMLSSAVGIAISPLPFIVVIMLFATPRGLANGLAFVLGWVAALAALITAAVLAGSELDTALGIAVTGPKPVWSWGVRLLLGGLLLLLGLGRWLDRPREGRVHRPPKWMQAVDRCTPGEAAGLAAALVATDPKNLALALGGAVSIATGTATGGGQAVAVVLMVLVGSSCVLLPSAVHLFGGARSGQVLGEWKAWMSVHNAAVTLAVVVVLGAAYVGDAISGLTV